MDDDQAIVLGPEVANFQHGHAVASRSDGHGELVLALVRVVEDGVAERVSDVLVRNLVLARWRGSRSALVQGNLSSRRQASYLAQGKTGISVAHDAAGTAAD